MADTEVAEEHWDKRLHNVLTADGLTWEQARFVVGIIAVERQEADRQGYNRGFEDGYTAGETARTCPTSMTR